MSAVFAAPRDPNTLVVDVDLSQAAGTYTLLTASGGAVAIYSLALYVTTAGTLFTSVSIETDATTPFVFLSAADGALANITSEANVATTWNQLQAVIIGDTHALTYTIAGAAGTGNMRAVIRWLPVDDGTIFA